MGKRLIQQRRGRGGTVYRSPSFRSKGSPGHRMLDDKVVNGTIKDIISCSLHSAPLMKIEYEDGEKGLMIAPEGVKVGEQVMVGGEIIDVGNCLSLKNIPEGSLVYNIESMPGDGGKFCRASGVFARVAAKFKDNVLLILPSKKQKLFMGECRANIGVVAGGGRPEKPILRAGTAFYKMRAKNKVWPIVAGSAMNAVAHPFGNKRTSRKSKARPAPRNAPPGRNVGMLHPRRTGRKKK